MKTTTAMILALSAGSLIACGGTKAEAANPDGVTCPPGQSFDGQYCQVDQNVATIETEAPPEAEAPPEEAAESRSEAEAAGSPENQGQDGEGSLPTEGVGVVAGAALAPEEEEEEVQHAAPVDITMAAQAAPIIQYLSSSHLPAGARRYGSAFAGQFAEGQILEQKLQVTKGKCYTVVAVAMPPVTELNVELFEEGADVPLLQDSLKGTQAVIGSRNSCYVATETGSLKLVLTVEGGNGVAAAQVFQK